MADEKETSGLVTLVCITCGREQFHARSVPQSAVCDRCGSTVFRTFQTPVTADDATIDALESQSRSISYGDPSPDGTRGDARDLDLGSR